MKTDIADQGEEEKKKIFAKKKKKMFSVMLKHCWKKEIIQLTNFHKII